MIRFLTTSVACALALPFMAQIALVDQTPGQTGSAVVSQVFEASLTNYNSFAADDFIVATGENWHIDSIILMGQYASPNTPVPGAGMFVSVYSDNSGVPGTLIFSDTTQVADPDNNGALLMTWETPPTLAPGHYWLVAGARKDAGNSLTQWEWFRSGANAASAGALWQNPGGGYSFVNCPSWSAVTNCYGGTELGLSFSIYGCPVAKPQIQGLPEDTSYCDHEALSVSVSTSTTNGIFAWSNGDSGEVFTTMSEGAFWVELSDTSTGCSTIDSFNVLRLESPEIDLQDDSICQGVTHVLDADLCATCSVVWSNGSTNGQINVNQTGSYSAQVTDNSNGCTAFDTAFILVLDTPMIEFNRGDSELVCADDEAALSTLTSFASYAWSTGETTASISVPGGHYSLTVTDAFGCASSKSITLIEVPNPDPEILVTFNAGLFILSLDQPYSSYSWSTGSLDSTISVEGGFFQVVVLNEHGCLGTASVEIALGSDQLSLEDRIRVYPVPVAEHVVLEGLSREEHKISLLNLNGGVILRKKTSAERLELDLSSLPRGGYLLSIASSSQNQVVYLPKL